MESVKITSFLPSLLRSILPPNGDEKLCGFAKNMGHEFSVRFAGNLTSILPPTVCC